MPTNVTYRPSGFLQAYKDNYKDPSPPEGRRENFGVSQTLNIGGMGVGGGQEPYEQGLTLFIKFQLVTPYVRTFGQALIKGK